MIKKSNLKIWVLNGILVFSVLFLSNCKKESLLEPPSELQKLGAMKEGIKLAATGVTSNSYYLVNSLPSGFVRDGSRDYTSYVQDAINKYSNIVFPGFPILINDKGINVGSNKTITFEEGSEVRLKATSKEGYNIFNIYGVSNVTLYNPVIVGDRDSHTGTTGEWGMGIGIRGSTNITIYNPTITKCWGDGIYIGQIGGEVNCKNIVIKDAYLRRNRRDGISIIAVDGLLIDNIYAGYNEGTVPGSGINFEANNAACELKNVRINNPHTEYNGERGIQLTGHHMLDNTNKTIDITIVNHKDIGSPSSAFKFSVRPLEGNSAKMFGVINFVNPTWQKTVSGRPLHILTDQLGLKIAISSPEIMNLSGAILSWSATYTSLSTAGPNVAVTSVIDPIFGGLDEAPVDSGTDNAVVFAVNAGGSLFKASNGITYSADKNYSGGNTFRTSDAISNTSDDILYQSERFGNFSYSIPVSNGTYEITFRMAEIFHNGLGERRFDILVENNAIVSNLDLFAVAGLNRAYDIVKTVSVTDGLLKIDFRTDLDNAKIAAFHVKKK
ncbi:hypothetical protein GZH53_10820 [Flavihumibacter sp. R14]|nr:hypothetical protein [Flavihumibacter soli]